MDKTTKELRARLRARYEYYRESIGRPEPASGIYRWLGIGNGKRKGEAFQSSMGERAEGMSMVILRTLAGDEEVDFLCKGLRLERALIYFPADEFDRHDQWIIARPDGTSFRHYLQRASGTLSLFEPILEEWIKHLADDAPDLDGLTPDARAVLLAMHELEAFCVEAKITQSNISDRVAELGEEIPKTRRDNAISLLRQYGYVETKASTATWLTARGRRAAESLKSSTKPD
jgi:hypothetical protein